MTAESSRPFDVAYLGPQGSFAHLVAEQRYPNNKLIPFRSIPEVFEFLEENKDVKGVVPIENSSGGMIVQTVDGIIEHALTLFIEEELSLNVKLALMGRRGETITAIYSHSAPINHCEPFIRQKFPKAKTIMTDSTSAAAQEVARSSGAAVIGPITNAEMYGLEVLEYPILENVPNVTQFFVMGHTRNSAERGEKTSLVMALPNHPGSLYSFLKPFADSAVNLTRIESRPIAGQPNTYRFLVELIGTERDSSVAAALRGAETVATQFHIVGAYPVLPRYHSRELVER